MSESASTVPTRAALTDRTVQSIRPPERGVIDVGDARTAGLALRVTAEGTKIWSIRYRPKGKPQRRATLGHYPVMSLAKARTEAAQYTAAAKLGRDLAAERDAEHLADQTQRRTLRDVLTAYVAEHCKLSQRSWKETERVFDLHLAHTALADKPLAEIKRGDIQDLQRGLIQRGYKAQTNRVLTQVKAALNWAVDQEWIDANPAARVKRQSALEVPRDRVLSPSELRALWIASDTLSEPSRTLVKMLMLTGQRGDEVRGMRWDELDRSNSLWIIPAERSKTKRSHLVPLPRDVAALLAALPRLGPFVFTVTGVKPYAGQVRLKRILDRDAKTAEWPSWVFHDFRRTAGTVMAQLGVGDRMIARVLGHAQEGVTEKHYNRYRYLEEQRAALQRLCTFIFDLVAPKG